MQPASAFAALRAGAVGRLLQFQFVQHFLEALAIFGHVDRIRRGADDRHAVRFQVARELQRRLPAVLHDHAEGLFDVHDFQHVFQRQRLEIQPIRGIVVGRHRLRIAVDHDGLVAVFAQRQRRMHAAIIELDALADAIRPAAQHHDFLAIGRLRFALFLVGRIHIRGVGGELGGAGIHAFIDRADAEFVTAAAHICLGDFEQMRQTPVGKALALQGAQSAGLSEASRLWSSSTISISMRSLICARNHGSIWVSSCTSSSVKPVSNASPTYQMRSGPGLAEFFFDDFAVARDFVQNHRRRLPGRAALSATTPGKCGRSPSLRPPISSAWSGGHRPAGIFRTRNAESW